jgi:hypothetical protein
MPEIRDNNHQWTAEATEATRKIDSVLTPVVRDLLADGWTLDQIVYLIGSTSRDIELLEQLRLAPEGG